MASWWVTGALDQPHGPVILGSWVLWVIGSICLHELGHGIAAIRVGDNTPLYTGHMTFNPLVHMGATSLICFALFGFTWGLMPVDPSRFRGRYAEAIVAGAGPMVNVILAILCVFGAATWIVYGSGAPSHIYTNVRIFLTIGAMINVMGVLFNLIPVPPLDGARILGNFVPSYERLFMGEKAGAIGLVALIAIFFFGGRLWGVAGDASRSSIMALVKLLGGQPTPLI